MRVSVTVPNSSNPQKFNLIYDGCPDTTKDNLDNIKIALKEAKKMYIEKEILQLTGMGFVDFVNFNESKFDIQLKELDFVHIDI